MTVRARVPLLAAIVALLAGALTPPAARGQDDPDDHDHAPHAGPRHEAHGHDHGGFPEFVDIFATHHAYLERKVHPRFGATVASEANRYEEAVELAWQLTRRLGGEIDVPVVQTDPELGDGASGVGDIEVAPMVALVTDPGRRLIVTARSGFLLPTGDEDEDLGVDGWAWEPALLAWKGFGPESRAAVQAELGYGRLYADEGEDEEEIVYNVGLSYWLPSDFIPIVELNGVRPIGATEAHDHDHDHEHEEPTGGLVAAHGGAVEAEDDLVSTTVGFRYAFANGQQWGAGVQVPLHDTEAYDWRVVVGGIIHLP